MPLMQWLVFGIGVALLVVHGIVPDKFVVDGTSILLLFLISIPVIANYLRKAKFPGAEFEFKDAIAEARKVVAKSVEEAETRSPAQEPSSPGDFDTFRLDGIRDLLSSDPVLALAALRIEIERKLRSAADRLGIPTKTVRGVRSYATILGRHKVLSPDQVDAIERIARMCNEAIHGANIRASDAAEIISLAEDLNQSFNIGHSINLSPNPNYAQHGLLCEYEHCIEHMPLREERGGASCHIFGHDCPGGEAFRRQCTKTADGIPRHRFISSGE